VVSDIWEHSGGCSENHSKHTSTRYDNNKQFLNAEETIKARDARRIIAADMKYVRRTAGDTQDRLQNKYTNCIGIKNNTNIRQITGIQGKLDTTCK
jgi:hypothetical protein